MNIKGFGSHFNTEFNTGCGPAASPVRSALLMGGVLSRLSNLSRTLAFAGLSGMWASQAKRNSPALQNLFQNLRKSIDDLEKDMQKEFARVFGGATESRSRTPSTPRTGGMGIKFNGNPVSIRQPPQEIIAKLKAGGMSDSQLKTLKSELDAYLKHGNSAMADKFNARYKGIIDGNLNDSSLRGGFTRLWRALVQTQGEHRK